MNGLIQNISVGDLLASSVNVGLLSTALIGFTGFDSAAPCTVNLTSMDPFPQMHLHKGWSEFVANMAIAFSCKRHNVTEDPYEYCFNLTSLIKINASIIANETTPLINITFNSLSVVFNKQIPFVTTDPTHTFSFFSIGLLNTGVWAAIAATVLSDVNTLLAGGINADIVLGILGISFFYFDKFALVSDEELLYARLTPAYNISWASNSTTPNVFDLTSLQDYFIELQEPITVQGIEMYMNEKLSAAFDL